MIGCILQKTVLRFLPTLLPVIASSAVQGAEIEVKLGVEDIGQVEKIYEEWSDSVYERPDFLDEVDHLSDSDYQEWFEQEWREFVIENPELTGGSFDHENMFRFPYLPVRLENTVISITGPIEPGDQVTFERFAVEAVQHKEESGEVDNIVVNLSSIGGDFDAALEIAQTVRERGFTTFVERGETCLSACAIIFMAGFEFGDGVDVQANRRSRFIEWPARLGFHSPYIRDDSITFSDKALEVAPASVIRKLIDDNLDQFTRGRDAVRRMIEADPGAWSQDLLLRLLLEVGQDSFVEIQTVGDVLDWEVEITNIYDRRDLRENSRVYLPDDVIELERVYNFCYNSVPHSEATMLGWHWDPAESPIYLVEGHPPINVEEKPYGYRIQFAMEMVQDSGCVLYTNEEGYVLYYSRGGASSYWRSEDEFVNDQIQYIAPHADWRAFRRDRMVGDILGVD